MQHGMSFLERLGPGVAQGTALVPLVLASGGLGTNAWGLQQHPLPEPHPGERTNVLLILADQWNARCFGPEGGFGGLQHTLTPELDEWAAQGTRFTRGYTQCPQCKPARMTLLTGLEQREHGVRWNDVWDPPWIETLAHVLRDAGYWTATIGKHHLPWLQQPEGHGIDHGFDEVVDLQDYFLEMASSGKPHWYAPGNHVALPGLPPKLAFTGATHSHESDHPVGYWEQRSREFLEARAQDEQPFFLVHSLFGPHTPILPSDHPDSDWAHRFTPSEDLYVPANFTSPGASPRAEAFRELFEGLGTDQHREVLSLYYGLISQIDASLGRLLTSLEELELDETTLVILTADHGELASEFSSWTKGGPSVEALVRVPFVVRAPSGQAGGVCDALVSHMDVVPTILEATGVPAGEEWRAERLGASLLPWCEEPAEDHPWRSHLVVDFGGGPHASMRALITERHKLIEDEVGSSRTLFDLLADPWEVQDLSGTPWLSGVESGMLEALDQWEVAGVPAPAWRGTSAEHPQAPPAAIEPQAPEDHQPAAEGPVRLRWLPSTSAVLQRLHAGPLDSSLPLVTILPASAGEWVLPTLAPGQAWGWRVDTVNVHGATVGPTWTFSTSPNGHLSPGAATMPRPARLATVEPGPVELLWTAAAAAARQRVWGRVGSDPWTLLVDDPSGTLATATWPSTEPGRVHAWRVDAALGSGWVQGEEWRFKVTETSLPGPVRAATPRSLSVVSPGSVRLRAEGVTGALRYRLHAGREFPLPVVAEAHAPSFQLQGLQPGERWAWRIDTLSTRGVRRGFTQVLRVR